MSIEGNKRKKAAPSTEVPPRDDQTAQAVAQANQEPPKKGEKFKVVLVDIDDIADDAARDAAERHLTESKEGMRGVGGFFKKMWKHGMAREYYHQKQLIRSREMIREHGDIYAAEQDPRIEKTAHEEAMRIIVDRFASEYEETVHEGETRSTIDRKGDESQRKVHEGVTNLIKEYAAGTLTDENFREARTRLLETVSESREDANKKSLYADNLLEVARQVKLAVDHGTKLEDLDLEFDIKVGEAKSAIRTKPNYNAADRIIESIKKTPVGRFVNEGTLATSVAIGVSVGAWAGKRALTSNVAKVVTFGGSALAAAGFTGFAENKRLKEDRTQHAREMAQGRTYEHGKSPRREEMDKYIHQMEGAGELTASLRAKLFEDTSEGKIEERTLSAEERGAAIAQLADIEARIALSDKHSIDLLSYSAPTAIERERLDLDLMRAQAKVQLRKALEKSPDGSGKDLATLLELAKNERIESLTKGDGGIEERNKLFDKMKRGKVARAAIAGAVGGLAIGAVVQEAGAFFDSHQVGAVERLVRGDAVFREGGRHLGATPVESLRALLEHRLPQAVDPLHSVTLGENGHVRLPEGMTLSGQGNEYTLTDGDRVLARGLSLTNEGGLDQESIAQLEHQGLIVSSATENVQSTVNGTVSPSQYLGQRPTLGTHVARGLWFDNDTPAPVFDRNELRLWWGGEHNQGLDANGQYTFSMDHMTPGGSFHSGLTADAQRLMAEGKLRILLSVSQDTQATPIEVPIGPDGAIHIDPDSETGRLLFRTDANGHAEFLGRFAEVAEVTGNENGTEHVRILATYEGQGLDTIPAPVTTTVPETTTTINAPHDYTIEPPPIIPIWGRRPLEPINGVRGPNPLLEVPIAGYYYNAPITPEQRKEYEEKLSPALRGNPDAALDAKAEAQRYLESLNEDYRAQVELLAEQAGDMSSECKLSICIPVAGHQEGDNIEKTLSCYLNQTADPNSYEIVLFVNQPDLDKEGNRIRSDGTLGKIQAFKKKHPELPIRVMQTVLPRSEARIGHIRKLLNDATVLRSSLRTEVADVVLVSNDADTRGVAPTYVENLEVKFDKNSKTEAFFGQLDWDPESYIRNPLVHIGARLYQYFSMQNRRAGRGMESSGANFAFRSSIYTAIGGYNTDSGLGEDNDLGRRIMYSRLGSKDQRTGIDFAGARVSRIYTSSRRAEKTVQDGRSFIEQWNAGFSAFDDDVRKVKWEETGGPPDYDDPVVVEKLTRQLEATINRTLMVAGDWWAGDQYSRMSRKALGMLGLKYRIVSAHRIEITDASRLIAGLKEYQEDGMEIMARKTAKPGTRENKERTGKLRREGKLPPKEKEEKPKKPTLRVTSVPGQKPKIRVTAPRNQAELEAQQETQRRIANGG